MAIAWDSLEKRYDELSNELSNPSLDSNKRHLLQKEFSNLSRVLQKHREITEIERKDCSNQKRCRNHRGSGTCADVCR